MENNETKPGFLERLAETLGGTANATRIYGTPVERDGVTVIPVAKAKYGFGGGSGKKTSEEGTGGGGGMSLSPVGYIEIKQGSTRFRTTRDPQTVLRLVAVGSFFAFLTVRSVMKAVYRRP